MKQIIIKENEAGQRLDKFLAKYMKLAPKSFFYKMLRKKNIVLNGKKADGSEKLVTNDEIKLFLSDETINKFSKKTDCINESEHQNRDTQTTTPMDEERSYPQPDIIYENKHVCLLNKPCGTLSQKAAVSDISMNEIFLQYMKNSGQITKEELRAFTPAVCNRLDRNTSGLIIAGKTLYGLQIFSEMLKNRSMQKYYYCIVAGVMKGSHTLKGYLTKNPRLNQVEISGTPKKDSSYIETTYETIEANARCSFVKVHLVTGKPHQIRGHLASMGFPIIGDRKYGDSAVNRYFLDRYGLKHQLLHSSFLVMPQLDGDLKEMSFQTYTAPFPTVFQRIMKEEGFLWPPGHPED